MDSICQNVLLLCTFRGESAQCYTFGTLSPANNSYYIHCHFRLVKINSFSERLSRLLALRFKYSCVNYILAFQDFQERYYFIKFFDFIMISSVLI